jgi:hypothetical protein
MISFMMNNKLAELSSSKIRSSYGIDKKTHHDLLGCYSNWVSGIYNRSSNRNQLIERNRARRERLNSARRERQNMARANNRASDSDRSKPRQKSGSSQRTHSPRVVKDCHVIGRCKIGQKPNTSIMLNI